MKKKPCSIVADLERGPYVIQHHLIWKRRKKKTYNNTATINDWEREKEGENRERGVERERKGILNEASI